MLTKQCLYCGKTFPKGPTVSLHDWTGGTKFCSRPCYWAYKRQLPPSVELAALYESGLTIQSIADRYQVDYKSVYEQLQNARVTFRKNTDYDLPQMTKRSFGACERCGKTFDQAFRRGGTGKPKRFCGLGCKVGWYRGDRVYNYVGEFHRYGQTFWLELAAKIRERDRVCRKCGKTAQQNGKELDVHHVIPFRLSNDHSEANLVTLCVGCHSSVEKMTLRLHQQNPDLFQLNVALLKEFPWLSVISL